MEEKSIKVQRVEWDKDRDDYVLSEAPEHLAAEAKFCFASKLKHEDTLNYTPANGKSAKEIFEDEFLFGGFEQWVEPFEFEGEQYFVFEWSC